MTRDLYIAAYSITDEITGNTYKRRVKGTQLPPLTGKVTPEGSNIHLIRENFQPLVRETSGMEQKDRSKGL